MRRWWWVSAVLVAAALLAGALIWRAPVAQRASTADELSSQAGPLVAEIFSADAKTWRADRDRARELMTPSFAGTARTGLTQDPPDGVAKVEWKPISTGVVHVEREWGSAQIVAQVTITGVAGEPAVATKTVNADFVRSGDHWLLDGLDELR